MNVNYFVLNKSIDKLHSSCFHPQSNKILNLKYVCIYFIKMSKEIMGKTKAVLVKNEVTQKRNSF